MLIIFTLSEVKFNLSIYCNKLNTLAHVIDISIKFSHNFFNFGIIN